MPDELSPHCSYIAHLSGIGEKRILTQRQVKRAELVRGTSSAESQIPMNRPPQVDDGNFASHRQSLPLGTEIGRPLGLIRGGELHSRVHRRQSILPTKKKTNWRPHLREYTRPAYAVSSPSQKTDPSESILCNRLRPSKDRRPHNCGRR
jgi:hypothetical protein